MNIKEVIKYRIKKKSKWIAISVLLGILGIAIPAETLEVITPLIGVIIELI